MKSKMEDVYNQSEKVCTCVCVCACVCVCVCLLITNFTLIFLS